MPNDCCSQLHPHQRTQLLTYSALAEFPGSSSGTDHSDWQAGPGPRLPPAAHNHNTARGAWASGRNMFAAVCGSQLLQMHFLWWSAVVVRGLKLKFKWCVRVSPVSVWASRALGTKPKLYPGHSQPSPPPYSCLYTHNMKCYGDFKIIMFFHKHSIHLTYFKWSTLLVFYVLDILQYRMSV